MKPIWYRGYEVKSGPRSKFSNLAIGKRKREKYQGLNDFKRYKFMKFMIFFRLLRSNCLNWKIYFDDHSSFLSLLAYWLISYWDTVN